ncbi:hypothetical protein [Streptomyces lateritius]|uniref:hypothetical protein n=1 Tax=Streptomyces lateritius TaxID=67313 RepID=UPI0019C5D29A|nr:hypothetical protein [Streptomyces lateritius]GGU10848.1 hypothetical protein GCM10010272_64790 [Streptomyces lateritius]
MPENTVTTPLAPMELDDVAAAFAYIRAMQADDIDTACAIADDTGPELHRLLLDVAARVFIPVTAELGMADTIVRFTENILTEDHGDVAGVLRQLEAAGMKQAMEAHPAHRTTVVRSTRTAPRHRGALHRANAPHRGRATAGRAPLSQTPLTAT